MRQMGRTKIDPARFTDKSFTRRPTSTDRENDYRLMIGGLMAGRILLTTVADDKPKWFWTLVGPYPPPEFNPCHGAEHTLEAAQEAFKAKFWQWHWWAMAQRGRVTWMT